MNFFRCKTVACAEQRIHFLFKPRNLLLLHSKQMLTFKESKQTALLNKEHFQILGEGGLLQSKKRGK